MVIGKGHSGCIAIFVERKSSYLLAVKLESGTAKNFKLATRHSFAVIPGPYRKTLTLDNVSAMSNYEAIERHTGLRVYFAQRHITAGNVTPTRIPMAYSGFTFLNG